MLAQEWVEVVGCEINVSDHRRIGKRILEKVWEVNDFSNCKGICFLGLLILQIFSVISLRGMLFTCYLCFLGSVLISIVLIKISSSKMVSVYVWYLGKITVTH